MLKQVRCRNQQCCLHFWLLLEDPFEQLSGIVKNVDRHGKPALFLIMPDSCLRIIQAKTKAVRRRKSVNNATISYSQGTPLKEITKPAAFRRLCVETRQRPRPRRSQIPAAFRRLCVETIWRRPSSRHHAPAAFRRLCVETITESAKLSDVEPAAFRRLCVETFAYHQPYTV